MADTIAQAFREGHDARSTGAQSDTCPYYASSPLGDAWQAGFAYRSDFGQRRHPCSMLPAKVWSGRGYSVNVDAFEDRPVRGKARKVRLVYRVADVARLATINGESVA